MIECDVEVTLSIEGPFLCKSSAPSKHGVDASPMRNADGCPIIPGTHVRGRIREALDEIWSDADWTDGTDGPKNWFGPRLNLQGDIEEDNRLRRHAWYFGDFVCAEGGEAKLTRIKIDEETGSVQSGALLIAESAVGIGELVEFAGIVSVSGNSSADIRSVLTWLQRAACWIPSFGSFRNVGFGRNRGASLKVVSVRDWSTPSAVDLGPFSRCMRQPRPATDPNRLSLRLEVAEPFCLGTTRRSSNVFSTVDYLPGSVLKGAIAYQLQRVLGLDHRQTIDDGSTTGRWQLLCKHFDSLRFCTAFPVEEPRQIRPHVPPLSLFKGYKQRDSVRDASLIQGPFCLSGARLTAPRFSPDWKNPSPNGWPDQRAFPDQKLRVRTAINSAMRRVHDEQLFAQELVMPFQTVRDENGLPIGRNSVAWLGAVDVNDESLSEQELIRLLDDLAQFLEVAVLRIGKTKARATGSLTECKVPSKHLSSSQPYDGKWIVTLQSPCLLLDPRQIAADWDRGLDGSSNAYESIFAEVSNQSLKLVNRFTSEELHGGFLALRSQQGGYEPYLATAAGSVFVFESTSDDTKQGQTTIERWLRQGIDMPGWVKDRIGTNYRENPFLPSDGFGEVSVNVPMHLDLCIEQGTTGIEMV